MPGDDKIYGFNREDTIELINLIGNADAEFAEVVPREIGGSCGTIEYTIDSLTTATGGPYTGLKVATVTIETAPCNRSNLIGESVEVVDHSGCVFDLTEEELTGVWGWATERVALSLEAEADPGTLTPCHWAADDRCCTAGEGA